MKKAMLAGLLLLVVSFGFLAAQAATKKREFSGNATVQICAKDAAGKWQIVDELSAAGMKFQFSIADVVGKKPLTTDFAFSGRTKKGLSVSARLKSGATGGSDLKRGLVDMDLPLELTVNGKKAELTFKFTTESTQGAVGNISGRRAIIDETNRTAKLGMVSSGLLKDAGIAKIATESLVDQKKEPVTAKTADKTADKTAAKKESSAGKTADKAESIIAEKKLIDELFIVINGDGLLKAL